MDKTINVIVEKAGEKNYWCFMENEVNNTSVYGNGTTVRKAIDDFYSGVKDMEADFKSDGKQIPPVKFNFIMDVGSFFDYYPINVTAFAKYIGMNASLLRQYASGLKEPKEKALSKIKEGLQKFKNDFNVGSLIERPVTSYVK